MTDTPQPADAQADVEAIQKLLTGITPGEWKPCGSGGCKCGMVWAGGSVVVHYPPQTAEQLMDDLPSEVQQLADSAFIAAAPSIIRALLRERDARERRLRELEAASELSEFAEYVRWCTENKADGIVNLIRLGERELLALVKDNPEIAVFYMQARNMELNRAERNVEELTKQVNLLRQQENQQP